MGNRINAIDILRGVAIILMVAGHVYQKWVKSYKGIIGYLNFIICLMAPAFFLIIAGVSFYILINKRINKNFDKKKIFYEVVKRALFLSAVSLLFQLLFGAMFGAKASFTFFILYWSIFQLISITMIIFFFIPFLEKNLRILLYSGIFFLIFLSNHLIIYYKLEFLYFLIQGGSFPFLPWSNFYLFGIGMGDLLINISTEKLRSNLHTFLLIGIVLFTIYIFGVFSVYYLRIGLYFQSLGAFFILLSIFYYISDVKESNSLFQRIITKWGNYSFSMYYIHWVIIGVGMILFPLIINDIYKDGLSNLQYFFAIIIVFLIIELFFRIWEKFDYKFGLEWFMNRFSKKLIFSNSMQKN